MLLDMRHSREGIECDTPEEAPKRRDSEARLRQVDDNRETLFRSLIGQEPQIRQLASHSPSALVRMLAMAWCVDHDHAAIVREMTDFQRDTDSAKIPF